MANHLLPSEKSYALAALAKGYKVREIIAELNAAREMLGKPPITGAGDWWHQIRNGHKDRKGRKYNKAEKSTLPMANAVPTELLEEEGWQKLLKKVYHKDVLTPDDV